MKTYSIHISSAPTSWHHSRGVSDQPAEAQVPSRCWRWLLSLLVSCLSLMPLASQAQTSCTPISGTDWMVSSNELAAYVRPADCAYVTQTPPDFGWPELSSDAKYQVTLTYPDGRVKSLSTNANWLNWNEVLPAGYYGWQVQVTNSSGTKTSLVRHFTVDSSAQSFLVPDAATLYSKAISKAHPRGLPDATTLATMVSQRQAGLASILDEADGKLGVAPQKEPTSTSAGANWSDAHDECKRTLNVAMAYIFTKQSKYLTDATTRLRNLASWSPTGTTSYKVPGMDMGAREIAWTMALVYDWLQPQLDSSTRTQVLNTLQVRTQMMVDDVIGTRSRVAIYPRDSHGNLTLTILAAMSVILAGDIPAAQTWMQTAIPEAVNLTSPWGDGDSGHGNGTTQGSWDMGDSLVPWYVLRWGVGVDIAQKSWMRNWSNFLTYFIPPGTPSGTFGDGAETKPTENWARFGKAATWFAPTPLGRWYASQLKGEDPARMEVMLAPPADYTTAAFPSGTSNSMVLRGIGWAAMHSDLSNPARTSVYFKSSPYGSYNHSHGDQNSFVINSGGQRLAIDSGYYDDYKTAHWLQWYKQTKAHNAITYDGGLGQTIFETSDKIGGSKLTRYTKGTDYEIIYGDATPAYAGALQKAVRALIYLPPNKVLIYDNLASSTARQWEWNIHSINQMSSSSGTAATIQNGGQSLCVNVLGGPTTAFKQTNAFSANPTGSWTAQWHGTFYSTSKVTSAEFVTLLNVGCVTDTSTPAPSATLSNGVWTVQVAGKTFTIQNDIISLGTTTSTDTSTGSTTTTDSTGSTGSTGTTTGSTGSTGSTTDTSTAPAPVVTNTPFTGTPFPVPGVIEAENFDKGGNRVAYYDDTAGNVGGKYRIDEDVDIIDSCDPDGGGFVVNNFRPGEYLLYTIRVPSTARYDIALKVASNYPTNGFHVEIDGKDVTGSVTGLNTGSWCTFSWFGKTRIRLSAGTHVLKVVSDQPYFNLNSIRVIRSQ